MQLSAAHKNAALLTTEMKYGVNVPVANMCPTPGELFSFGDSQPSVDEVDLFIQTKQGISKLIVQSLSHQGIAIDSSMGDIHSIWASHADTIRKCDPKVLLVSGNNGMFDADDEDFILNELSPTDPKVGQIERLVKIALKADDQLIHRIADLSEEVHAKNPDLNSKVKFIVDHEWGTQDKAAEIANSVLTAAGRGDYNRLLQPSSFSVESEHDAQRYLDISRQRSDTHALWDRQEEQRASDKLSLADKNSRIRKVRDESDAAMQRELKNAKPSQRDEIRSKYREKLNKAIEMINENTSPKILVDIFSLDHFIVLSKDNYGMLMLDVLANERAETYMNVTKLQAITGLAKDFLDLQQASWAETKQILRKNFLQFKETYKFTPNSAQISKWAQISTRAAMYRTALPELVAHVTQKLNGGEDESILNKFCREGYYSRNEKWMVVCDVTVILFAKRTRYKYSENDHYITAYPDLIRAITRSLSKCIDIFPENIRLQNCLIQMIKPSWLTMTSHNLLRSDSENRHVRAEWHASSMYMKALLHTEACLKAIVCVDKDMHYCLSKWVVKDDDFIDMIPSKKRKPISEEGNPLDHFQKECNASLEDVIVFCGAIINSELDHWYHTSFEGLGKAHHIIRPVLVSCTLLMLKDLRPRQVTRMDDLLTDSVHDAKISIRRCDESMRRIVSARHITKEYTDSLNDLIRLATEVNNALQKLNDKNMPKSEMLSWVLGEITNNTSNPNLLMRLAELTSKFDRTNLNTFRTKFYTMPERSDIKDPEYYRARESAVVLALGRIVTPFFANIHDEQGALSFITKRPVDLVEMWNHAPYAQMLRRVQLMFNIGEANSLSQDRRIDLESDWKGIVESLASATKFPQEMRRLNNATWMTIVQAFASSSWLSQGRKADHPTMDDSDGWRRSLYQKRVSFVQSALSLVQQARAKFLEKHPDTQKMQDCPGTLAGYWRRAAVSEHLSDIGTSVEAQDMFPDVARHIAADSLKHSERPGTLHEWRSRKARVFGDAVLDPTDDAFLAFGAAVAGKNASLHDWTAEYDFSTHVLQMSRHHKAEPLDANLNSHIFKALTADKSRNKKEHDLWKVYINDVFPGAKARDPRVALWHDLWDHILLKKGNFERELKRLRPFEIVPYYIMLGQFVHRHNTFDPKDESDNLAYLIRPAEILADSLFLSFAECFVNGSKCAYPNSQRSFLEFLPPYMSHRMTLNQRKVNSTDTRPLGSDPIMNISGCVRELSDRATIGVLSQLYAHECNRRFLKDKKDRCENVCNAFKDENTEHVTRCIALMMAKHWSSLFSYDPPNHPQAKKGILKFDETAMHTYCRRVTCDRFKRAAVWAKTHRPTRMHKMIDAAIPIFSSACAKVIKNEIAPARVMTLASRMQVDVKLMEELKNDEIEKAKKRNRHESLEFLLEVRFIVDACIPAHVLDGGDLPTPKSLSLKYSAPYDSSYDRDVSTIANGVVLQGCYAGSEVSKDAFNLYPELHNVLESFVSSGKTHEYVLLRQFLHTADRSFSKTDITDLDAVRTSAQQKLDAATDFAMGLQVARNEYDTEMDSNFRLTDNDLLDAMFNEAIDVRGSSGLKSAWYNSWKSKTAPVLFGRLEDVHSITMTPAQWLDKDPKENLSALANSNGITWKRGGDVRKRDLASGTSSLVWDKAITQFIDEVDQDISSGYFAKYQGAHQAHVDKDAELQLQQSLADSANARLAELAKKLATPNKELGDKNAELAALQDDKGEIKAGSVDAAAAVQSAIDALTPEISTLTKEQGDVTKNRDAAEKKVASLTAEIATLDIGTLKTEFDAKNVALATIFQLVRNEGLIYQDKFSYETANSSADAWKRVVATYKAVTTPTLDKP